MSETSSRACIGLIVLLASPVAAAPHIDRESTAPVTTINARELDQLPTNRNLKDILSLHNEVRTQVSAQPLRWNPVLADHAQSYARTLADTGQLQHASREGRRYERENISLTPHGVTKPLDMARLWAREQRYFRPGVYPNVCTGDWSLCAHYTQMIWPTTTDLGCGYAPGPRWDALVCRYSPPGNRDGYPIALPRDILRKMDVIRPAPPPPPPP